MIETDICVIGAGAGGLSVAAGAVQMGARVVLIEAGAMGGDCLNHGCVPSKALIAAAQLAASRGRGAIMGIAPAAAVVDFAAVHAHIQAVIAGIAPHDSQERFERLGVQVLRGHARFTGPRQVAVGGEQIRAKYFVIATGSRPAIPAIPGLADVPYLTNETIFQQVTRPEHLIIIGGGPVGLEMAQAHARLGSKVTVLEGARLMAREDPELIAPALAALRADGVVVHEGVQISEIRGQAGAIAVALRDGTIIEGSHLLVATGRKPNIEQLDLAAAGVTSNAHGVVVDAGLRSRNRRVFAVGDAAGGPQFTHVAGYHAGIVLRRMLFWLPARVRTDHIPRVTYLDPEVAQIGLTEAEAPPDARVLRWSLADNDRARASRNTDGLIKVIIGRRGRILGAGICAPGAGELIAPWALAISAGLRIGAMAGHVVAYPTLSEINKRVAGSAFTAQLFSDKVRRVVRFLLRLS